MSRSLPRGIIASAALSVMAVVILIVVGLSLSRNTIRGAALASVASKVDMEACATAPASWGWSSGVMSFYAYSRAGESANPAAAPLEPELLREALSSGSAEEETEERVVYVVTHAASGPCAVLRVTSANVNPATRSRMLSIIAVAMVGGMLLAALGTYWFVAQPLRSRVDALALAAKRVGEAGFVPEAQSEDALGHIAEVLAASHRRIVEARAALEDRNRALENHLAGVAHDLRTPLASMQLALEALATTAAGTDKAEARRALADIVYLSALVENLHQGTRLRQEVDVTSGCVDLAELVRRLEHRFAIVGRHANVAVAANTPENAVWAACTPALAERALANLIQNAVEHHPGGGHVAVTLSVSEDTERFEVVVVDDGPGLPAGTLASLEAETFLTQEARPRGPGLGMLITAEVAKRADWEVRYEPQQPTGLKVVISGWTKTPSFAGAAGGAAEL